MKHNYCVWCGLEIRNDVDIYCMDCLKTLRKNNRDSQKKPVKKPTKPKTYTPEFPRKFSGRKK